MVEPFKTEPKPNSLGQEANLPRMLNPLQFLIMQLHSLSEETTPAKRTPFLPPELLLNSPLTYATSPCRRLGGWRSKALDLLRTRFQVLLDRPCFQHPRQCCHMLFSLFSHRTTFVKECKVAAQALTDDQSQHLFDTFVTALIAKLKPLSDTKSFPTFLDLNFGWWLQKTIRHLLHLAWIQTLCLMSRFFGDNPPSINKFL